MKNKLIEESLKEETSFSSNEHGINSVVQDSNISALINYSIPQKYNKTKIVLLPVNKNKFYFYWEFTNKFLNDNLVDLKDITFHIVDENHNLITIIKCESEYGEYFYINKHNNIKSIKVIAVYKHGIQFKHLLDSNSLKVMNKEIIIPKDDVWINKQKGFTEIIRASMTHFTIGMSSKNYVDEIASLREYEKLSKENFSSHTVGGDK